MAGSGVKTILLLQVSSRRNNTVPTVRRQGKCDKLGELNSGGFLVHRNNTENRNESQIRNRWNVRAGCQKHQAGQRVR